MRITFPTVLLFCAAVSTVLPAAAVPVKKKPAIGVKGTQQMAGSEGQFGQTYTVVAGDGFGPINFTLVSAEYSVDRIDMDSGTSYAPKANEKLLIIHYKYKNPGTDDMYVSSRPLFQAVDANNNTIPDSGDDRRMSEKTQLGSTLKPGQGFDDLMTYIVVPADLKVPKLILQMGRAGSSDLVIRYPLGTGANVVKPLQAPYVDASDPTGSTALQTIPATLGTTYHAGYLDFSLDSVELNPGPIGDKTPDDGKQFLVASITAVNKSWPQLYFNQTIAPTVVTDDDKITDYDVCKAGHDEGFEGRQLSTDESVKQRILVQVPKDATLKTLSLAEAVDNSGGFSKAFVYDISGVK